ncbi:MAG: BrnT family toxin [Gammaproteobacteria bacterium]
MNPCVLNGIARKPSETSESTVCPSQAITVFYDRLAVTLEDPDHSIEELRFITFGYSAQDHLLVIAHTDRADGIRIISARTATPRKI